MGFPARSSRATFLVLIYLLASETTAIGQATRGGCLECDQVVSRVMNLLSKRPERVEVIDVGRESPALQQRIEHAEGFVSAGDRTVYLKKQGTTFQQALKGPGVWDYVLAIIVWHEMAHLAGADEREAQRQEELLWQQFVLERHVDSSKGLKYLALLRDRRRSIK